MSRYTICSEFCGYSQPRPVIRFCGEFVASFPTYAEADTALARLQAAEKWILLDSYADCVHLYVGDGKYRVTYGAQVRDFAKWQDAASEFGVCKAHAKECDM